MAIAAPAGAEALLLVDADSGKVLRAENATYPWYPASLTKLMTLYMTLSAVRDHRISFDTLFTVSANSNIQAPTKMGFPVGTPVTVDNALKMMMVKSANDMAVLLAEGIGGSIDQFAADMTETAHRLGMSETQYVNPNGLPDEGQITSARDLAILARALIKEFPDYSGYWHIPAIRYGRRVVRNYNPLLGRYPGTDGMKTGFVCMSGFNLVATATRDNKHLIAVVLGAPSSAVRAQKAAAMLEGGFALNPLAFLTPSLGTVDNLAPIDASPPNLKDSTCGPHRRRPAAEDEELDASTDDSSGNNGAQFNLLVSALRPPKNFNLLADPGPVTPVVVYTGPTRTPEQIAALQAHLAAEAAETAKRKGAKHKTADAKPAAQSGDSKSGDTKSTTAKPAAGAAATGKPTGSAVHWTPTSAAPLATSPAPDSSAAKKKPKPDSAATDKATQ